MKNIILSVLLLGAVVSCKNEQKKEPEVASEKVETTKALTADFVSETLELTHCESAVFNPKNDRIYASLIGNSEDGDGSVALLSMAGEVLNAEFVTGLNDPKGIAITNGRLYVTDVTVLVEADLDTGEILKRHTTDGTQFLNDVAVAPNGALYVSDTFGSVIYELFADGYFSQWLADAQLDNPNGVLVQGTTMYVASWGGSEEGGAVSKIDMTTKTITSVTEKIGRLDGIRPYDEDHLVISDWRSGKVHLVNTNKGTLTELTQVGQSVGDIAYVKDKDLLLLPMNTQSRLLFYSLK